MEIRINKHICLGIDKESLESYIKHQVGGKWELGKLGTRMRRWLFTVYLFICFSTWAMWLLPIKILIKIFKENKLSDWKVGWVLKIFIQTIWKIAFTVCTIYKPMSKKKIVQIHNATLCKQWTDFTIIFTLILHEVLCNS